MRNRSHHSIRARGVWFAVVVMTAIPLACSSGSEPLAAPETDEITAVPFPSTVELTPADLASLQPDSGDGTLQFTSAPPSLQAVEVGNVLVGGVTPSSPNGLLRAVLAVERDGEALTLRTAQAPIQLAYKKLHVRFSRSTAVASSPASSRSKPMAPLGGSFDATQPFDYVLFDGDGDPDTTNDQIVTDGTIGGGFDYQLELDVDWGGVDALPDLVTECLKSFVNILVGELPSCSIDDLLPEAKVTFVVNPKVQANANVHGAAILEYEKEVDLVSEPLAPIILGPLVFVPVVDLTAHLYGGASASFTTGVHGSAVFETAVTVSSKQTRGAQFSAPVLKSTDFGPNETSITLHAEARVGAGARLNLLLFGVTGPYATARAYASIEADLFSDPCWSLHAGIEANLGVKVTSPALPFIGHVTLADWHSPTASALDVEIASGECDPAPDSPTLPPGSGPDASHFANPTYTPWSRTFSSPVEGALAGSPGNSTAFSDLQRTIDGSYVRAGFGVLTLAKLDEQGSLVWARDLDLEGGRLFPIRVRPTRDGALLVASSAITAPIVLTKLAQDGSVLDARAFDIPVSTCTIGLTSLAQDGADGHYVSGSCVGAGTSFLLHARPDDATFWLLDAGDVADLGVRVAESIEGDAFLAGAMRGDGDALFAMRVTPQGQVVYANRYDGCPEAPDAIPSAAIVGSKGDVTIAGSGGAQHNGILLRLRPDGAVGFASSPGFGFGAGSVFLLDSVAELPTTGFVAGGSSVRFTGESPDNVPSAGLVGFDATGKILWARRYTFGAPDAYEASGHVGVRLADDGGVFATAFVSDPADPLGGRLWAFKPFAKDGSITFSSGSASVSPLEIVDLTCSLEARDQRVSLESVAIPARSVSVTSTPAQLSVSKQTGE